MTCGYDTATDALAIAGEVAVGVCAEVYDTDGEIAMPKALVGLLSGVETCAGGKGA